MKKYVFANGDAGPPKFVINGGNISAYGNDTPFLYFVKDDTICHTGSGDVAFYVAGHFWYLEKPVAVDKKSDKSDGNADFPSYYVRELY